MAWIIPNTFGSVVFNLESASCDEFLGSIIKLCQDKRGLKLDLSYSGNRAVLNYELPLNEVVFDFNDRLKSVSSGYASFDYEISGYKESDLVKMSILVNSEPVDALSMIIFFIAVLTSACLVLLHKGVGTRQ